MEAIKKQASKLREQVAKQQQAVLRHLGKEAAIFDDDELQCHQNLQNLYNSTREAKHFQRDIVRGVEGFVSASKKQLEIDRKLAENCCKYGTETQSGGSPLARAALQFGTAHGSIENEKETMLGIFVDQVSEPLRLSITGAPLEDARHLTHRYERLRQEVEAQTAEVIRRQARCKYPSVDSAIKLKNAEARLTDHRTSMAVLQREATAAMLSVEDQQQQLTFQKLLTMVLKSSHRFMYSCGQYNADAEFVRSGCLHEHTLLAAKCLLWTCMLLCSRCSICWLTGIQNCPDGRQCCCLARISTESAIRLCHFMRLENFRFDSVTLTSILSASADMNSLKLGRVAHCYCYAMPMTQDSSGIFWDNDSLAALLAMELKADLFVLLSDVDGLYSCPPCDPHPMLLHTYVKERHQGVIAFGDKSRMGRGGMDAKVKAVVNAAAYSGTPVVVASGFATDDIIKHGIVLECFKLMPSHP